MNGYSPETGPQKLSENQLVFGYLVDALKVANSPYKIINNDLIMAQCQVDIAKTFFRPARTETLNLQMVCSPDLLEKYPGSELVTRGSFRLQWLVDGIRKRGLITRVTYPYDLDHRKIEREILGLLKEKHRFFFKQPILYYHPHLLVNFKTSFETDEGFDELSSLSINLVTGEISTNTIQELKAKKFLIQPPKKNLEKRKISYRDAYQTLLNHLKWHLQNHDSQWVKTAQSRWEEEVNYLESYYRGNLDQDLDQQSFYRRMAETYRKYRPIIRIQLVNAAVLYLPLIRYTLESYPGEPELPDIIYDPVRRKLK
ncbi:MAG: hypothetical protein GXY86_17760 [Firmicutes bacterium]|nr:hypothetical protein [Bacillota bacterium]